MQMSDQREIKADPATVYSALLDPEMLKQCVPGAEEVSGNVTDGYEATVTQKVGPVKATFKGQVTMTDMVENEKITITGEGKGGAAGFAKGGAVSLQAVYTDGASGYGSTGWNSRITDAVWNGSSTETTKTLNIFGGVTLGVTDTVQVNVEGGYHDVDGGTSAYDFTQ